MYALSSCQTASQGIKYHKVRVGCCMLSSHRTALLQTGFCSHPTSSNKHYELLQFHAQWRSYFIGLIFICQPPSYLPINPSSVLLVYQQVEAGGCCADQGCIWVFHWIILTVFTLLLSSIHTICSLTHLLSYSVTALCQVLSFDLDFTWYKNISITILLLKGALVIISLRLHFQSNTIIFHALK